MLGVAKPGSDTMQRMTARDIANDIAERIAAGDYAPAAQLHYGQLADLYDVSQATIKRAMALLRDRRLVEDYPGRGVFVCGDRDDDRE